MSLVKKKKKKFHVETLKSATSSLQHGARVAAESFHRNKLSLSSPGIKKSTELEGWEEVWGREVKRKKKTGERQRKVLIHGLHWHVNRSACFCPSWERLNGLYWRRQHRHNFTCVFVLNKGIKPTEIASLASLRHFWVKKNKGLFSYFPFGGELGFLTTLLKLPRFHPAESVLLWVKVPQGFVSKNVQLLIKDLFLLVLSCAKI